MASFRYAPNVPPSAFQTLDPPQADGPLQLVFSGQCLDGYDPQAVRQTVASALKLDEKRAARLFSGKRVVLRRELDVVAAHRYIARFSLMGAVLRAEPSEPRPPRRRPVPTKDVPASSAGAPWRWPLQWASIGVLSIVVGLMLGLLLGPVLNALLTETQPPGAPAASGAVASVRLPLPTASAAAALAQPAAGERIPKGMTAEAVRERNMRYLGASGHKAFAISTGGAHAWHAGAASEDEACERALDKCMKAQRPTDDNGCWIVDVDGNWEPMP